MAQIPMPEDCFLRGLESPFTRGGEKVYRSPKGKYLYTWDAMHGHVEVFDAHGYHIGVVDKSGRLIGDDVPGRKIDV